MLEKARNEIDWIDAELVKFFEKRMDAVAEIARIKKENNLPVFDSTREMLIIEKAQNRLKNPEYDLAIAELFQHLMNVTKTYQNKIINK